MTWRLAVVVLGLFAFVFFVGVLPGLLELRAMRREHRRLQEKIRELMKS